MVSKDLDDALSLMSTWLEDKDISSIISYADFHIREISFWNPEHAAIKEIEEIANKARKLDFEIDSLIRQPT
jgi:hypothetical protein